MRILGIDDNHCMGVHRNVAFILWGEQTTLGAVASSRAAILEFGKAHATGIGMVTIVPEDAQVPSAEVRAAIAGLLRDAGAFVKRSALVQEGSGFRAAAVRGVVTGLTMLAKQAYPHQVFGAVDTAAAWLVQGLPAHEGSVVGRGELVAAVGEARKEFEEQRSRATSNRS